MPPRKTSKRFGIPTSTLPMLTVILLLSVFVNLGMSCVRARLRTVIKRPYDRPKYTRRGECVPLNGENTKSCPQLTYKTTFFPNILRSEDLFDANVGINVFKPLWEIDCNSFIRPFLCSVYFPQCSDKGRLILPCKSFCEKAKDKCDTILVKYGFDWPPAFNCSLFPDDSESCDNATWIYSHTIDVSNPEVIMTNETIYMNGTTPSVKSAGEGDGGKNESTHNVTEGLNGGKNSSSYNETDMEFSGNGTAMYGNKSGNGNDKMSIQETIDAGNGTTNRSECQCPADSSTSEDLDKASACIKGDYRCRHATAKAYVNGKTLCCFHNKDIVYTSKCARTGNHVTSCQCSYSKPSRLSTF